MKTVFKRLFSFMLVAMMLVSVVPFQASAATYKITFVNAAGVSDGPYDWDSVTNSSISGEWFQLGSADVATNNFTADTTLYARGYQHTCNVALTGDYQSTGKSVTVSVPFTAEQLKAAIAAQLGNWIENYNVGYEQDGEVLLTGFDSATVRIKAKEFPVTVKVDAEETTVNKKYGSTVDLTAANYKTYDAKLLRPEWEGNINDGDKPTVTGSITYTATLVETGWKRAELYDKDTDGEYKFVGYAYMNDSKKIVEIKDANNYSDQEFLGWNSKADGTGSTIHLNDTLNDDQILLSKYYAVYKTNINNGISQLKVKAVYFVDGIEHSRSNGYIFNTEVKTGTSNVLTSILSKDGNMAAMLEAIKDQAPWAMTEVNWDKKFYDTSFTTVYSDSNLTVNGDRTVYVKINAEEKDIADVMLYIHKSASATPTRIIEMKGYLPGDDVTLADAKAVANGNGYYADSYKMYTDREWTQLLNSNNPKYTETIEAEFNGTTKVHLLLTGAYTSSNNSDNPKTGDTIMMTFTVLGLSAAALAAVYFLNKKKAF